MSEMCSVCIIRAQRDLDAEAAINAAENLAYERGVKAGYAAVEQAEQDMLAKCIEVVEAFDDVDEIQYILAALRALQEKP